MDFYVIHWQQKEPDYDYQTTDVQSGPEIAVNHFFVLMVNFEKIKVL